MCLQDVVWSRALGVVLVLALVPPAWAGEPRFPAGGGPVVVGAEVFDRVLYLPVRVNDGPELSFVLDTGAPELSAVEMERVASLGLTPGATGRAEAAGDAPVRFARLGRQQLRVGGLAFPEVSLSAVSLKPMEAHWGRPKDGVLGGNVLRQAVVCLDYSAPAVTFHRPEAFDGSGRGRRVALEVLDNALLVSVALVPAAGSDPISGRFLIDTAVRQSFLTRPFVTRHRLLERIDPVLDTIVGYGLGGEARGRVGRLRSVAIGGHAVEGPVLQLCTETSGPGASRVFDGILGADLLSLFTLCFDYGRSEMWIARDASAPAAPEYDASGLVLVTRAPLLDAFEVAHVVEGSPAAEAGVRVGDRLVSLDDRPAASHDLASLRAVLSRPGGTVGLVLERGGTHRRVALELRPLL
jgi:hypothetical protein